MTVRGTAIIIMTPEQKDKFEEFEAIRETVGKTILLSSIFDEPWFKETWPEIKNWGLYI